MSRSVSAPSSVTNTSPCWNGDIVPGSTLRYGSNFSIDTRRPRSTSNRPSDAAAIPFPSEETTPPVTKMYLVVAEPWPARDGASCMRVSSGGEGRPLFVRSLEILLRIYSRTDRLVDQRDAHRQPGGQRPELLQPFGLLQGIHRQRDPATKRVGRVRVNADVLPHAGPLRLRVTLVLQERNWRPRKVHRAALVVG